MQVCENVFLFLFSTDQFNLRNELHCYLSSSQYPEGYLEAQEKKLLEKQKKTDGKDVKGSKGKRKRSQLRFLSGLSTVTLGRVARGLVEWRALLSTSMMFCYLLLGECDSPQQSPAKKKIYSIGAQKLARIKADTRNKKIWDEILLSYETITVG